MTILTIELWWTAFKN